MSRLTELALLLAGVIAAFAIPCNSGAQGNAQPSGEQERAANALKLALPDFSRRLGYEALPSQPLRVVSGEGIGQSVAGRRRADALSIDVYASIADSIQIAQQWTRRYLAGFSALPLKGSKTGRKFGEEVWRSPNADPPAGDWQFSVRDGRTLVIVKLHYPPAGRVLGKIQFRVFTAADIRMAEDLAIGCLNRLTTMGLTSRSARTVNKKSK
jgi:hypothetical protein